MTSQTRPSGAATPPGRERAPLVGRLALEHYLSGLTVPQGRLAGEPFTVLDWQREFPEGALGPNVFGSVLSMSRGGGKSTFIAALALAAIEGPLAQPNSEVQVVAPLLKQARVIFRHVLRFLGDRGGDRKQFRTQNSVNNCAVECLATGVLLELRGANPKTLHGAAPSLVIVDEAAQIPDHYIEGVLAALETSLGKIPGSRIWKIGTRASTDSHPFSEAIQTADFSLVYAADPDDDPFDRATWAKACPSLDHMPDLEAIYVREAEKAKVSPERLASFRALRLNLGVPDVLASMLIEAEEWARAEGVTEALGPVVWGCDPGTSAASSAVAAYWPESGRLECLGAFPEKPCLRERGLRDGVGGLYQAAFDRNELITAGGHAVSIAALVREALERFGAPAVVVADAWRRAELLDALRDACVPSSALVTRRMGPKDGSADVRRFRRAVLEDHVVPVPSLYLASCMGAARTVADPSGNVRLAKSSQGGRRRKSRDDGAAAAVLAVAQGRRMSSSPVSSGKTWSVARAAR